MMDTPDQAIEQCPKCGEQSLQQGRSFEPGGLRTPYMTCHNCGFYAPLEHPEEPQAFAHPDPMWDNEPGSMKIPPSWRIEPKVKAEPQRFEWDFEGHDPFKASAPPEPPNYREGTDNKHCSNCKMYDKGKCWGYGNISVKADAVCDSWTKETQSKTAMAADPHWLDHYINENGPYLYHFTKPANIPHILQHGLLPWDDPANPIGSRFHALMKPRPGHVYLTNERGNVGRPDSTLRVDLRKLDPSRLNPDEDAMASSGVAVGDTKVDATKTWPGVGDYEWMQGGNFDNGTGTYDRSRGDWAHLRQFDDPSQTAYSLEGIGTVAHQGPIPPEAIDYPYANTVPNAVPKSSTTNVEAIQGQLESKLPINAVSSPEQDGQGGNLDDYWQPGKSEVQPGWRWPFEWDVQDPVQLPTKPRTMTGSSLEHVREREANQQDKDHDAAKRSKHPGQALKHTGWGEVQANSYSSSEDESSDVFHLSIQDASGYQDAKAEAKDEDEYVGDEHRPIIAGVVEDVQDLDGKIERDHVEHEVTIWLDASKSVAEDIEDDAHHEWPGWEIHVHNKKPKGAELRSLSVLDHRVEDEYAHPEAQAANNPMQIMDRDSPKVKEYGPDHQDDGPNQVNNIVEGFHLWSIPHRSALPSHNLGWAPGQEGKGFVMTDGSVWTWPTKQMRPTHKALAAQAMAQGYKVDPHTEFHIQPDGQVWQFPTERNRSDDGGWRLPGQPRVLNSNHRAMIRNADPRLSLDSLLPPAPVQADSFGHAQSLMGLVAGHSDWWHTTGYLQCPHCGQGFVDSGGGFYTPVINGEYGSLTKVCPNCQTELQTPQNRPMQMKAAAERIQRYQPGAKQAATSWHLTDNPQFAFDPDYNPANNTTLGGDWPNKGLFMGDPEHWFNGYDYVRPYAAEIEHPDLKDFGGYGGESFLPASEFPNSQVKRVIPLDEYARETYRSPGWYERDLEGVDDRTQYPEGYRYNGPDVRDFTPEQHAQHAQRAQQYIEKVRPHMLRKWDDWGNPVEYGDPRWERLATQLIPYDQLPDANDPGLEGELEGEGLDPWATQWELAEIPIALVGYDISHWALDPGMHEYDAGGNPIAVMQEGDGYHLFDGAHRVEQAKAEGRSTIMAYVLWEGQHQASFSPRLAVQEHRERINGNVTAVYSVDDATQSIMIQEWSSTQPGQGNTTAALQSLKAQYPGYYIVVYDAVTMDAVDYWKAMQAKGLVDEITDEWGTRISKSLSDHKDNSLGAVLKDSTTSSTLSYPPPSTYSHMRVTVNPTVNPLTDTLTDTPMSQLIRHLTSYLSTYPVTQMADSRDLHDPYSDHKTPAPHGNNDHPDPVSTQLGCSCHSGDKLNCPIHGLDGDISLDQSWFIPETTPVGQPDIQTVHQPHAVSSVSEPVTSTVSVSPQDFTVSPFTVSVTQKRPSSETRAPLNGHNIGHRNGGMWNSTRVAYPNEQGETYPPEELWNRAQISKAYGVHPSWLQRKGFPQPVQEVPYGKGTTLLWHAPQVHQYMEQNSMAPVLDIGTPPLTRPRAVEAPLDMNWAMGQNPTSLAPIESPESFARGRQRARGTTPGSTGWVMYPRGTILGHRFSGEWNLPRSCISSDVSLGVPEDSPYGGPRLAYGEGDTSWANIVPPVPSEDTGIRVGNPSITEHLGQSNGSRGTGHFGTGIYFGSHPDRVSSGWDIRNNVPLYGIDLTGYNLYKPRDFQDALNLHDALHNINTLASNPPGGGIPSTTRTSDPDEFAIDLSRINIPHYHRNESVVRQAIDNTRADVAKVGHPAGHPHPDFAQYDSASTRVMKGLGYHGIDTRHIPEMDNTMYGSVLYRPDVQSRQASHLGSPYHYNPMTGRRCRCLWGRPFRTASQNVRQVRNQNQKAFRTPEGEQFLNLLEKHADQNPDIEGMVPWLASRMKHQDIHLHEDPDQLYWRESPNSYPMPLHNSLYRWAQWFNAHQHPLRRGVNIMGLAPHEVNSLSIRHAQAVQEAKQKENWLDNYEDIQNEPLHVFGPEAGPYAGYRVHKIETADQAEGESNALGHCIGNDDQPYKENIVSGNLDAYSLRDKEGYPKVSWHLNPSSGEIGHMQGSSGYPKDEYRNLISQFNQAHNLSDHEAGEEPLEGQQDAEWYAHAPDTVDDFNGQYHPEYGSLWEYATNDPEANIGDETVLYPGTPDWERIANDYVGRSGARSNPNYVPHPIQTQRFFESARVNGYLPEADKHIQQIQPAYPHEEQQIQTWNRMAQPHIHPFTGEIHNEPVMEEFQKPLFRRDEVPEWAQHTRTPGPWEYNARRIDQDYYQGMESWAIPHVAHPELAWGTNDAVAKVTKPFIHEIDKMIAQYSKDYHLESDASLLDAALIHYKWKHPEIALSVDDLKGVYEKTKAKDQIKPFQGWQIQAPPGTDPMGSVFHQPEKLPDAQEQEVLDSLLKEIHQGVQEYMGQNLTKAKSVDLAVADLKNKYPNEPYSESELRKLYYEKNPASGISEIETPEFDKMLESLKPDTQVPQQDLFDRNQYPEMHPDFENWADPWAFFSKHPNVDEFAGDDSWRRKLQDETEEAMHTYQRGGYEINHVFRNADKNDANDISREFMKDQLDHATETHPPIQQPHTLWRFSTANTIAREMESAHPDDWIGNKFIDHGYTSTATDPKTSYGHGYGSGYLFAIRAQPGQKGFYMPDLQRHWKEREWVLPRGTQYQVSHVTWPSQLPEGFQAATHYTNGNPVVHLDIVGNDQTQGNENFSQWQDRRYNENNENNEYDDESFHEASFSPDNQKYVWNPGDIERIGEDDIFGGSQGPMDYYYHGAPSEDRTRIQTWGLQPAFPGNHPKWQGGQGLLDLDEPGGVPKRRIENQPRGVYVSTEPWGAMVPRGGDVWKIDPRYIHDLSPDPLVGDARVIPHVIPPEALTLHTPAEEGLWNRRERETIPPPAKVPPDTWYPPEWGIGRPGRMGAADWTDRAVREIPEQGGGTYHPETGESPETGYQVAVAGRTERYPEEIMDNPQEFAKLLHAHSMRNQDLYSRGDHYIGPWVEEHELWIDPSENVQDRNEAVRLGVERNQRGIWDNLKNEFIPTGGTGYNEENAYQAA